MHMSNADIVKEYKEAKDRSAQVKILADENCCDVEKIIEILVDGGIDHRCFSMLRRKRHQAEAESRKPTKKIPYKKPEIIPEPPKKETFPTLEQAVAAIKAKIAQINRQQYELDMQRANLYCTLEELLGEAER